MIEEAIQQAVKEKEEIKLIEGKQSEARETTGQERIHEKSDEMSEPPNQNNIFLTQVGVIHVCSFLSQQRICCLLVMLVRERIFVLQYLGQSIQEWT